MGQFVAVEHGVAQAALRQGIRHQVEQVVGHRGVLVIAANTLREVGGRDIVAELIAALDGVRAVRPGHVVGALVHVADAALRVVGVGAHLQVEIVEDQVREGIQARERLVADRFGLVIAVESQTQFVHQAG